MPSEKALQGEKKNKQKWNNVFINGCKLDALNNNHGVRKEFGNHLVQFLIFMVEERPGKLRLSKVISHVQGHTASWPMGSATALTLRSV